MILAGNNQQDRKIPQFRNLGGTEVPHKEFGCVQHILKAETTWQKLIMSDCAVGSETQGPDHSSLYKHKINNIKKYQRQNISQA